MLTGNKELHFTCFSLRNCNQSLSFHVEMFLATHILLTCEIRVIIQIESKKKNNGLKKISISRDI